MTSKIREIRGQMQQSASNFVGKAFRGDQEVWRVSRDGKIKNIITRSSSTHSMDEAVIIYRRALERLADR